MYFKLLYIYLAPYKCCPTWNGGIIVHCQLVFTSLLEISMRTAKLVMWLHWQLMCVVFLKTSSQPLEDQEPERPTLQGTQASINKSSRVFFLWVCCFVSVDAAEIATTTNHVIRHPTTGAKSFCTLCGCIHVYLKQTLEHCRLLF